MNPRRIYLNFVVFARSYLRSRIGLFFALVFPVILILLFGAIFSNSASATVPVYVQNNDHNSPVSQEFLTLLNRTSAVSVTMVSPSAGNLSNWLRSNGDSDGIEIPEGFQAAYEGNSSTGVANVTVITSPESATTAGIVQGVVEGVVFQMNLERAHGQVVIGTQFEPLPPVGNPSPQYIDYLVPGLIGFTVLTSPMFSMVNISSEYKKEKIFRQLSLTPLTKSEWLSSAIIWYVMLSCISTAIMILVGSEVYGARVSLTPLILPFLIVGPLLFVSLGLLAGSVSKDPESAAVVGNLVTFPMMFLSGTFFPVALFPAWLVPVAHVLPLFYVIDGLNQAMLFGNVAAALFDLAVVAVLALIFFVAAVRAFQWRQA